MVRSTITLATDAAASLKPTSYLSFSTATNIYKVLSWKSRDVPTTIYSTTETQLQYELDPDYSTTTTPTIKTGPTSTVNSTNRFPLFDIYGQRLNHDSSAAKSVSLFLIIVIPIIFVLGVSVVIYFILRRNKEARIEAVELDIIDQGLQYDGNAPNVIAGGEEEIPSVFPQLEIERREKQA